VLAADGGDLFCVVAAVDQVEATPLMDAEGAEDVVGDGLAGAEDGLGLIEEWVYGG
jgi:hypothetical protein